MKLDLSYFLLGITRMDIIIENLKADTAIKEYLLNFGYEIEDFNYLEVDDLRSAFPDLHLGTARRIVHQLKEAISPANNREFPQLRSVGRVGPKFFFNRNDRRGTPYLCSAKINQSVQSENFSLVAFLACRRRNR